MRICPARQIMLPVACLVATYVVTMRPSLFGQDGTYKIGKATEIKTITVSEMGNALRFDIRASNPLSTPKTFRLTNPSRLVLDFAGTFPALNSSRIAVNSHDVVRVRFALFSGARHNNPVTRVVLDLNTPVGYQLERHGETFSVITTTRERQEQRLDRSIGWGKTSAAVQQPKLEKESLAVHHIRRIGVLPRSVVLHFDTAPPLQSTYLKNPPRVLLDFKNTFYATEWSQPSKIRVNGGGIVSVRHSLFRKEPPVVRVVVDQEDSSRPRILTQGQDIILRFSGKTSSASDEKIAAAPMESSSPSSDGRTVSLRPSEDSDFTIPEQLWASPPTVTYEKGLLTLDAKNSRLIDVLFGIARKTGATIEVPDAEEMKEYIVVKIGPAPPSDVIATILQGSAYNYYIVENSDGDLQKVILTPK